MLMQGDLNKIIEQVNRILEGSFTRIEALEDKVQALELANAPKKRGRPPKVRPEAEINTKN